MGNLRRPPSDKKRKPVRNNKWNSEALSHMREVAFGIGADIELEAARKRADAMRDDVALENAAEAKRLRKMKRNQGVLK